MPGFHGREVPCTDYIEDMIVLDGLSVLLYGIRRKNVEKYLYKESVESVAQTPVLKKPSHRLHYVLWKSLLQDCEVLLEMPSKEHLKRWKCIGVMIWLFTIRAPLLAYIQFM